MRSPIRFVKQEGTHSRQAHADLPTDAPFEREIGRNGFFGGATHMHHQHAPTGWVEWTGELRPRLFDTAALASTDYACATELVWDAPVLLHNAFMSYRIWQVSSAMDYLARNADGDDLLFIHRGSAALFCDYGHMTITTGDYVVIPRGTMWRVVPLAGETLEMLMIEATNDAYMLPDKGILGGQAIFDPAVLDTPSINEAFKAQYSEDQWQVKVKRHQRVSTITYPFNPLDALGWHGEVSVVRVNWRDIRPVMSHRYHLPPSAHTTFMAQRFVVCTFVPRPLESDPGALKVPFYHSNEDYDEVLFYHAGDFFSRDNIAPGMVSFHPAGFAHGPHPKAYANAQSATKTMTQEVAVMVDTRDALYVGDAAQQIENPQYVNSWQIKEKE